MAFVPFSNEPLVRTGELFINIDKNMRFTLSAEMRKKFVPGADGKYRLYIAYDEENNRIGISTTSPSPKDDIKPYVFDSKGNASARNFIKHYGIDLTQSLKFKLTDMEKAGKATWLVFEYVGAIESDSEPIKHLA